MDMHGKRRAKVRMKKERKRLIVLVPAEMYALVEETAQRMTYETGGVRKVTKSDLARKSLNDMLCKYWGDKYKAKLQEKRDQINERRID